MHIIAKAKPIRIRIKSGGEEHFSLDSLRQNLNVQDLWPLIKDNRLSRWLRQLGEVDLAHEIDALSESQLNFSTYFKVLVIFLKDDLVGSHVTELYTLFSFWHDCEKKKSKNYDSLRKYLLSKYEGAKFIFKQYPEEASDGEWWNVSGKPNNPAPVIINISDGVPYFNYQSEEECKEQTIEVVNQIKAIDTADGKVQIFNAMIGNGTKAMFPDSKDEISTDEGKFLYDISTEIPDSYKGAAEKNGFSYKSGARGLICQCDGVELVGLIDFGSSKGQGDR